MTQTTKRGNNKGRDSQGKFLSGNTAGLKHGAWSLTTTGKIPSVRGRREIQRDLQEIRTELERVTPRLTVQKKLLINQIIRSEGQIRLIELYFKRCGIMRPDRWRRGVLEPHPVTQTYLSFLHSQRNALMSLGIEPGEVEEILTPYQIIEKEEQKRASS